MNSFNPAILIPVYNHQHVIRKTVEHTLRYDFPILLVDDGSDDECRMVLESIASTYSEKVTLLRLDHNSGKGAAVKRGFRQLFEAAYTHALQLDADGQHDLADVPQFMQAGMDNSDAMIAGYPRYDDSVPKGRYYSRYLTHVWVWINTLSFNIKDSMCGFRLYPLANIIQLLDKSSCGDRMDFDTEIIVRWQWADNEIINVATKVHYPLDGISHFNIWHDNMLISWMHTRLFFGMLKRLPVLLWRKV